jgi:thymidylate synthase
MVKMSKYENDYLSLCRDVQYSGVHRESRAGRTVGKFGTQLRIDSLRDGHFPLLTTRRMYYKPVFGELAAFIRGATALKTFKDFGCNYWDMNAKQWPINHDIEDPNRMHVGKIYGAQWRGWDDRIDQLDELIQSIRLDPYGRRHLMTAWNPSDMWRMCLPPCHILVQAYVNTDKRLDLRIDMRSVDLCLGLPSDVVLYAAFLILLAGATDLVPGSLIFQMVDSHIYENHLATLVEQYRREVHPLPGFASFNTDMFKFVPEELDIQDYVSNEAMKYALN